MQPSVSIHNCSLLSGCRAVNRKVFTVIVRDVSLRKQSEDALRRSEERFSKAFRNNSLAITISTEAEGSYLDVNEAFLDLLGYRRKDVIGRTPEELDFWAEPLDRGEMLRQFREEDVVAKRQMRYRTAKGKDSGSRSLGRIDGGGRTAPRADDRS